jgi:hypothetical protein
MELDDGMIDQWRIEKAWKGSGHRLIQVLSKHLSGTTEEAKQRKPQTEWPVPRQRFELNIFRKKSRILLLHQGKLHVSHL